MNKFIIINNLDNVMIAMDNYSKGTKLNDITLLDDVKIGHKVALKDIEVGEEVIKYGSCIGKSKVKIFQGQWVHTHNVKTNLGNVVEYKYSPYNYLMNYQDDIEAYMYLRENGEVGIRNELWVIPTVGCVNSQARNIIDYFKKNNEITEIDGIYTFTHPYGCSQMGDDGDNTLMSLVNIIKHPNAGGVLILGLGCENTQVSKVIDALGKYNHKRIKYLNIQDVDDELIVCNDLLLEIYNEMKNDRRSLQKIQKIKIGLECGGSDGLSGITANPLIGRISDYFISRKATAVLTEIPEMFGAEQVILNQCQDKNVFTKLEKCINNFKYYYKKHGQVIYENPSPGNKAGGITTLEDKSLGCIKKAGCSPVVECLDITERISKQGLNIISSPGNDLVATTTLGMCGCQLVLFSTGRGTPFGGFVPTIKISTNNYLYDKKRNWIDFNAGDIDSCNVNSRTNDLIKLIIEVIEGKKTKNEINNFREIALFKSGVTL